MKELRIKSETPEDIIFGTDAPPVFIRANFDLEVLEDKIKQLPGDIRDYSCEVIDENRIAHIDGTHYYRTILIIKRWEEGENTLAIVWAGFKRMAALPDLSGLAFCPDYGKADH